MDIAMQRKDQFLADVKKLGFDDPFLEHYYDLFVDKKKLYYILSDTIDFEDSRMLYNIDWRVDEDGFPFLKGYEATLLKTHPIDHGVFSEIDTAELEKEMAAINWNTELSELPGLYEKILELKSSKDLNATDVAERLEARYWTGTAVSNFLQLEQYKVKFGKSHFFDLKGDISDVTSQQAYHLLSGRFIFRFEQTLTEGYKPNWFGLKENNIVGTNKTKKQFREVRYEEFDLHPLLNKYGIKGIKSSSGGQAIKRNLANGDITAAIMVHAGKEYPVHLIVDADSQNLYTITETGMQVPMDEFLQSIKAVEGMGKNIRKYKNGKGNCL